MKEWIRGCREIIVDGHYRAGRPQKTWDEVVYSDLAAENLLSILVQNGKPLMETRHKILYDDEFVKQILLTPF